MHLLPPSLSLFLVNTYFFLLPFSLSLLSLLTSFCKPLIFRRWGPETHRNGWGRLGDWAPRSRRSDRRLESDPRVAAAVAAARRSISSRARTNCRPSGRTGAWAPGASAAAAAAEGEVSPSQGRKALAAHPPRLDRPRGPNKDGRGTPTSKTIPSTVPVPSDQ